jgi:hypothetical protein
MTGKKGRIRDRLPMAFLLKNFQYILDKGIKGFGGIHEGNGA